MSPTDLSGLTSGVVGPGEPYTLAGNRLAFTSWFHVRPGLPEWSDGGGRTIGLSELAALDAAVFTPVDLPVGVRLVLEQPERDAEPMLAPGPGEQNLVVASVLEHEGRFLGWGKCDTVDGRSFSMFVTSEDGVVWERPDLGLVEHDGSTSNNYIPSISDMYPGRAISGAAVFVDPTAEPSERFKAITPHYFKRDEVEAYLESRGGSVDQKALTTIALEHLGYDTNEVFGLAGLTSPDGIHWTWISEPLLIAHADSQVIPVYDPVSGQYSAMLRDWQVGEHAPYDGRPWMGTRNRYENSWFRAGHRILARADTRDFRTWPHPSPVLTTTPNLRPTESLYMGFWALFPKAGDQQLLFPTVWENTTDSHSVHVCSSPDGNGYSWQWLPESQILKPGAPGTWDGGTVFAHPTLLELPSGTFALLYAGFDSPHKYPRKLVKFGSGFARWPKGRLAGIRADDVGTMTTVSILPPGRRLAINAVTGRTGYVRVEVLRFDGTVVPGRSLEDCTPLVGDSYDRSVSWHGETDLGVDEGEPVTLRVQMRDATLYWFSFDEGQGQEESA